MIRPLLALLCLCYNLETAQAAVFTVDTTSDSRVLSGCTGAANDCSLGGAIQAANAAAGADRIEFAIPGLGPHRIAPMGDPVLDQTPPLVINGELTIDGFTQVGAVANSSSAGLGPINAVLMIEIVGRAISFSTQSLLRHQAGALTLKGLTIAHNGLGTGIDSQGGRLAVQGCYVGLDTLGRHRDLNDLTPAFSRTNVWFNSNSAAVDVGGLEPAMRNAFAGRNSIAFIILAPNGASANVGGNLFGMSASGEIRDRAAALELLSLSNNLPTLNIGGAEVNARNYFAGFSQELFFSQAALQANIMGNHFGIGFDGKPILPSLTGSAAFAQFGVIRVLDNTSAGLIRIGGNLPGQANRFALQNRLQKRYVSFESGPAGEPSGATVQLFNNGYVLNYLDSAANAIIPLDLDLLGQLGPNDVNDADTGPNQLQNGPEVNIPPLALSSGVRTLSLSYRIDSAPANASYPLQLVAMRARGDALPDTQIGADTYTLSEAQTLKAITLTSPDSGAIWPLYFYVVDAQGRQSEFTPVIAEKMFADGLE